MKRGPEIEHTQLTTRERIFWVGMFGKELRHDLIGQRSRGMLVELMDEVAGGNRWCECPTHTQMLGQLTRIMWREPY